MSFILINQNKLKPLKPIIIFFVVYTLIFIILLSTIKFSFPFVLGFIIALLIQPIIKSINKKLYISKGIASIITTTSVYFIIFGIIYVIANSIIKELISIIQKISQADNSYITEQLNSLINKISNYLSIIDADFINQNKDQILSIATGSISFIASTCKWIITLLSSIPTIVTMVIVIVFSTYFFAKDMDKIKDYIKSLFSDKHVLVINKASSQAANMMGKYILSYLLIYFITFIETVIVFYSLNIKYPLVLSIVTAIADIIPVLGPGTVYIPLAVISFISGDYFSASALLIAWIVISIIREIIEPKVLSSSINIHPLAMIASIYVSFMAKSFTLLIYLILLFISYQVLKKVGIFYKGVSKDVLD